MRSGAGPRQPLTLVLNGDTFDLLQVDPRPGTLDLARGDTLLETALTGLFATLGGTALREVLRHLLDAGDKIVLIPGNHDAELYQPRCREVLLRALGLPEDHPGLELFLTPGPWTTQVGRWEVVVAHGHRADAFNDVDPHQARAAVCDGSPPLPLPPGSRLVLETIHLLKHAVDPDSGRPRFPFMDFLHPDWAVFYALVALDPGLAGRRIPSALVPLSKGLLRAVRRKLQSSPVLGPVAGEEVTLESLMADVLVAEMSPEQRNAPDLVNSQLEQWLKGIPPGRAGTLASGGGWVRDWICARLCRLSLDRTFFDLTAESKLDRACINDGLPLHSGPRALIVGHTHAARARPLMDERVYLNTGTWIPLMDLPLLETNAQAYAWLEQLAAGTAPSRLRQTWAEVTDAGPSLWEWREGDAVRLG